MSDPRSSDASADSSRPPRTIVLCFDGTSEQYKSKNTNVVKFFGLLCKDCMDQQVAYYQAGVGTYFAPGVVSPLWSRLASLLDEAVAWYLDEHVMGGYKFLMNNYHAGDKICLFGFSRGAYTARALAGMLHKVGLLPKDNLQQVDFAYKAYKRTDKEGVELAAGFKQTFSRDVKVEFVGVWDTVQSTGILVDRVLPFTESNDTIRIFRHALSLDEHRSRFRPNLYHWPTQVDGSHAVADSSPLTGKIRAVRSTLTRLLRRKNPRIQLLQAADCGPSADGAQPNDGAGEVASDSKKAVFAVGESFPSTDVLEVWFSGCHSDIGGGNVQDGVQVSLAQITLHWMVEQVMRSQCGILFDSDELVRIGFIVPLPSLQPPVNGGQTLPDSDTNDVTLVSSEIRRTRDGIDVVCVVQELSTGPKQPDPNPEAYPESLDAIAPLFDELELSKVWWLLEIVPCSNTWQDANGVWYSKWSINLGRGRLIPFQKPKFHHTVKQRMDYKPLNYKPRATYDNDAVYV